MDWERTRRKGPRHPFWVHTFLYGCFRVPYTLAQRRCLYQAHEPCLHLPALQWRLLPIKCLPCPLILWLDESGGPSERTSVATEAGRKSAGKPASLALHTMWAAWRVFLMLGRGIYAALHFLQCVPAPTGAPCSPEMNLWEQLCAHSNCPDTPQAGMSLFTHGGNLSPLTS